jgi:hypothetical protein
MSGDRFVEGVMAVSDRFLREQTFELVVAPAIADLQYDAPTADALRHARNCTAVLTALAWGLYEEITSDAASALIFVLLVAIPACYYTALVIACTPGDPQFLARTDQRIAIGGLIAALSLGPAIACYWPERRSRGGSTDIP